MGLFDAFRYEGKHAVVVGGATGMGAAVAEVVLDGGADVVVMDRAPVTLDGVTAVSLDLSDTASIDAAVDGLGRPVDALFSCAGVADGTPGIEKINFLGHRYMIERLLEKDLLPRGSAIGMISSAAGMGWESNLEKIQEYLAITDFDEASTWAHEHGRADYLWSKQCIGAYVASQRPAAAGQGHPHQRHPPRAHQHPAGPGQRRAVARLRRRLPRGGRHRGVDPARAGLPAGVPVQRGRRRRHRHHDDDRRRLLRLRHQRRLPVGDRGREVPPRRLRRPLGARSCPATGTPRRSAARSRRASTGDPDGAGDRAWVEQHRHRRRAHREAAEPRREPRRRGRRPSGRRAGSGSVAGRRHRRG